MPDQKIRVFSGVQPTGELHIGNYLGAIKRWVHQQDEKESFFCIVDLHAITVYQDVEKLRDRTRRLAALYIATGLDPKKSTIFVQSHVSAHAECCWILNCVTPVGWLERMTQYKVKAEVQKSVNTGLLDYPVLQAADILLYDANEVPVGEDQKQHVELTRDIAQRFNRIYGETFVMPSAIIPEIGARIKALNDPGRKMSKSQAHIRDHAIRLVDEPDKIRGVIRRAVTDKDRVIKFSNDPKYAGVNNLLDIYMLITELDRSSIEQRFSGKGYSQLKDEVADVVIEELRPIRERYVQLNSQGSELTDMLVFGANKARDIANPKLEQIKNKVGFMLAG